MSAQLESRALWQLIDEAFAGLRIKMRRNERLKRFAKRWTRSFLKIISPQERGFPIDLSGTDQIALFYSSLHESWNAWKDDWSRNHELIGPKAATFDELLQACSAWERRRISTAESIDSRAKNHVAEGGRADKRCAYEGIAFLSDRCTGRQTIKRLKAKRNRKRKQERKRELATARTPSTSSEDPLATGPTRRIQD